jgi:hypothetical protein
MRLIRPGILSVLMPLAAIGILLVITSPASSAQVSQTKAVVSRVPSGVSPPSGLSAGSGPEAYQASAYKWVDNSGRVTRFRAEPDGSGSQSSQGGRFSTQVSPPATPDPDLEPGFPVQTYETAGTYHSGFAIHTLVGNIDADPRLEILVTALATGPLYAWHWDGSPVAGFPVGAGRGSVYPGLGKLTNDVPGLQIFAGFWNQPGLTAYRGDGTVLPGWPRNSANYVEVPPSLADVNGDGVDEIFTGEDDRNIHGYLGNGSVLPGWPANGSGGQRRHTPAIGDLDGDCQAEVVTTDDGTTPGVHLFAYHRDGSVVAGFPVLFPTYGFVDSEPVIGDVDGDGQNEIVVVERPNYPNPIYVYIIAGNGTIKHQMVIPDNIYYGTAPALADLDGDGVPEIIVQSNNALYAFKGDGSSLPGWPVSGPGSGQGNSAPVVGDVDGDGQPDIAVTWGGEVITYDRMGQVLPHFPKALQIGAGAVPAIADVDGDGRNELVVSGSYWDGFSGNKDKVWMFDLHGGGPYGPVLWGQFMGGPEHQGFYPAGGSPCSSPTATATAMATATVIATSTPTRAATATPSATATPTITPVLPTPTSTATARATSTLPATATSISTITGTPTGTSTAPVPTNTNTPSPTTAATGTFTDTPTATSTTPRPTSTAVTSTATTTGTRTPTNTTTPSPTLCALSFSDVHSTDYFYQAVQYLYCQGAVSGYSDGSFRPYNNTTRGRLSKIVVLAEGWTVDTTGGPHFSDVPIANPFYPYIETAYNHHIISGYADGTFRWGNNVTRGQLSKIIVEAQQWQIDTSGGPHFLDVPQTDPFYGYIETAYHHGIISGYIDGTFRPGNSATRGQIAKIVYNAVTGP